MDSLFSKNEELEEVPKLVPNSTWFRSLVYQTEKSWSRKRRVVTKVCYGLIKFYPANQFSWLN